LRSENDVITSWLKPIPTSDLFIHPEDSGCPTTASKEGGEYMDRDCWSFRAFWVLPTKDSCSTEIGGLISNGNCDELDGNGEIDCNGDGNRGVNGDSNGNGDWRLDCDRGLNGNGNGNELDGDEGIDGNGTQIEGYTKTAMATAIDGSTKMEGSMATATAMNSKEMEG
jgi:hypothetical protein